MQCTQTKYSSKWKSTGTENPNLYSPHMNRLSRKSATVTRIVSGLIDIQREELNGDEKNREVL